MWRRVAIATLLAGLWIVATGPAAGAHAALRGSDPAAGSSIRRAPGALTLRFSEAPDPGLSAVNVLDTSGREVSGDRGAPTPVPGAPLELRVPLGAIGSGTYTVTWRVLSRVDGHVSRGSFAFGVGVPAAVPPAAARAAQAVAGDAHSGPTPLAVAARWAFYWGLALLLGAAATGLAVFGRRLPGRPGPLLGAGLVLAAVGLVAMTAATAAEAAAPLGRVLASGTGHWLQARGAALLLASVAVVGVARAGAAGAEAAPAGAGRARAGGAGWLLALGAAAGGGLLVHAMASHAAAPSPLRWLNLLAQWAHLLAVGVWIGGLAWLLAGIRGQRGHMGATVLRFSRLASWSLAVVVASGLLRAVQELGGWQRLLATSFGRALDVKLGLFVALLALGALNRFRVVPSLAAGNGRLTWLRRTVRGELWLAGGVLLAAAVLSELPPGAGTGTNAAGAVPTAAGQPAVGLQASGSDYTTTVRITLRVTPGAAGPNRFLASVADYDTGAPLQARRVRLTCSLPARPDLSSAELDLERGADGQWHGQGAVLSISGRWSITTRVEGASGGVTVPLRLDVATPAAR
jgi:copper transport protein